MRVVLSQDNFVTIKADVIDNNLPLPISLKDLKNHCSLLKYLKNRLEEDTYGVIYSETYE